MAHGVVGPSSRICWWRKLWGDQRRYLRWPYQTHQFITWIKHSQHVSTVNQSKPLNRQQNKNNKNGSGLNSETIKFNKTVHVKRTFVSLFVRRNAQKIMKYNTCTIQYNAVVFGIFISSLFSLMLSVHLYRSVLLYFSFYFLC